MTEQVGQAKNRRFTIVAPPLLNGRARVVRVGLFVALTGAVALVTATTATYLYFAPSVPEFRSIEDYQPKLGARIYSGDGQLIGEFAAERRVMVPPERIPELVYLAFTAAEDQRFLSHGGIDVIGVLQAVVSKILRPGQKLRGASTITQQVAKSLLAKRESYVSATARTLRRKVREAILAHRLERVLTKQQILYMYVHQIFLGHKAYGVQAAAEHYFRKNVWDLSLAEIATLAGLPQRPSDYSPWSRPEAAVARRRYVLRRMHEEGYITAEQRQQAEQEELTVYPREELYLQIAPYYTEQVRREIIDRYGESALLEDGFEIHTALNIPYQAYAREAVADALYALDKRQGFRGPLAHLATAERRALFKVEYRRHLGLAEGAELKLDAGARYLAVVKDIGPRGLAAVVDVAGREGILPLAAMRWAREPNPVQRVESHYLTDVRQALKPGDVVTVALTSYRALQHDTHGGSAIIDTVPKEADLLFRLEQEPIAQGALLSVDPRSGHVLAQVGGYDFAESTFNRAVQACREPGSAFKPVVYSAAIDKLDYTASTPLDDKPLVFDDPDNAVRWKPNNAGMEFRGRLPLRTCLKDSINTPAIRVAEAVGIGDVIKNARRLGITTELKRELGTAIGSSCTTLYDLIQVYVVINQLGVRRPLRFISRVVDRYGNVIEDHGAPWDATIDLASRLDRGYLQFVSPPERVLDEQTAFLMISLLKNVVNEGTGVAASRTGHVVAAKTGTTNDSYDAWFMGFTKSLVTGVWVGHDRKERPLGLNEQGARTALPAWVAFTTRALKDYSTSPPSNLEQGDFDPPSGVVQVSIDPDSGLRARPESARTVREYYRAGTEPTEFAPDRTMLSPHEFDMYDADTPL